VVSIEIVHRVNGSQVTDRVQLDPGAGSDPDLALRGFQLAADYFGQGSIVSSKPITEIQCFPAQPDPPDQDEGLVAGSSTRKLRARPDPTGLGLCSNGVTVTSCDIPAPTNSFPVPGGDSCSVSNFGEAVSFACDDSGLIVTRRGDVVVSVNAANIQAEVVARTQALRRLLGDANVLTNFHFNIVISPDQQAAVVDNAALNGITQQVRQASDLGQPLPDIQQLLQALPHPPVNVAFQDQLKKAYELRQQRLEVLAPIINGSRLSNQQINAFLQSFVGKSQVVDKLIVEHSAQSLRQAAKVIDDTISELANTDPLSTVYEQVKATARSLLESQTNRCVFDPDHVVDFVPDLYQFLTDADIDKRLLSAEMLIDFNEQLRKDSGAATRAAILAGPLGVMAALMGDDKTEKVWHIYDQVKAAEFYFDNTDPSGTSYDVHLNNNARTMFNIRVEPNSAVAYDAILVLNEVADYNAQTGKVTIDYQAIIEVNVQQALKTPDMIRQIYHTEQAYGALDATKDIATGMIKELWSAGSGIFDFGVDLWSDPAATLEGLKAAVTNWDQLVKIAWNQGADLIHRWPNMTAAEKNEFIGRVALEAILSLPAEARNVARIEEAASDAMRLHLDKAERGLRFIERTGVELSAEAASELAQRMERYGITTIDEMVEVADALDDVLPCRLTGGSSLRSAVPAAVKPPCDAMKIASLFNDFLAQAKRMGVTIPEEINDLLISKGIKGVPGVVVKKLLSDEEYAFASKIVQDKGGVFAGARQKALEAIDGFYQGHPAQLKQLTSPRLNTLNTTVRDVWTTAKDAHYNSLNLYIEAEQFTRDAALQFIKNGPIPGITLEEGILHSVDIRVEGGQWIHIEGGIVQ
jgi:DNA-binding transcriptional MerR regulator